MGDLGDDTEIRPPAGSPQQAALGFHQRPHDLPQVHGPGCFEPIDELTATPFNGRGVGHHDRVEEPLL